MREGFGIKGNPPSRHLGSEPKRSVDRRDRVLGVVAGGVNSKGEGKNVA